MRPREIFLSHSSTDRESAIVFSQTLRSAGLKVWCSESELQGAQLWHDEIGRALARCDWFVLLVTPAAVKSKWVRRELTYVLNQDRYQERIVPVLLKPCSGHTLSWTLGAIQQVDGTHGAEDGARALLHLWRVERPRRRALSATRAAGNGAKARA